MRLDNQFSSLRTLCLGCKNKNMKRSYAACNERLKLRESKRSNCSLRKAFSLIIDKRVRKKRALEPRRGQMIYLHATSVNNLAILVSSA